MPTGDPQSNGVWAADDSKPTRSMMYLIEWGEPMFRSGRSATVTLHDQSNRPSGWAAQVRAHHNECRLSETPEEFQNALEMLRRVLKAESQKKSDHSWAARYLPEDIAPTTQQLATTAVAESLRGGAFAYPMLLQILYAEPSGSAPKRLSGDRIIPVIQYGPMAQLEAPLSSYCEFTEEPPSMYVRLYPPGSITDCPTQKVVNVLMTGKKGPGSLWWDSVRTQVSAVLERFITNPTQTVSPAELEGFLEANIHQSSFTSLSVSDGHTSRPRGIDNPGFVWADFDVGRDKVYVDRGVATEQPEPDAQTDADSM